MKEFWQVEGPAPAVPEGVWEVPEGLPIAPAKTLPGSTVVPVERARKVRQDIREPRPAASTIAPPPVRSAPNYIRGPAKGGATAIPVVRVTRVPKDIREPAREGSRVIPVVRATSAPKRRAILKTEGEAIR